MRKGGPQEGLQRNVSNAFDAAMRRLGDLHPATGSFEEKINYWHSVCGFSDAALGDLHILRVWRNSSDHHDRERWRRDGPRSAEEASAVLGRVEAVVGAHEGTSRDRLCG